MAVLTEPAEQFCGRLGPCVVVTVQGQRRWRVTHDGELCEPCNAAYDVWQVYFRERRQAEEDDT